MSESRMLLSFCKMVGIHELYYSKDADIVDKTHLLGTNLARPCFTGLIGSRERGLV